jgi:hypothetical protein
MSDNPSAQDNSDDDDPPCTDCGDTGITFQTERTCTCQSGMALSRDDHFDEGTCWNCGGEGFIADCPTDYECIDPESGCDFCLRPCDVCNRPATADAMLAARTGDA